MSLRLAPFALGGIVLVGSASVATAAPPAPDVPAPPDAAEEDVPEIEPEPEPEPEVEPEPVPAPTVAEAPAEAEENDDDDDDEPVIKKKHLTIGGYLQPQYTYRVRRGARPRDAREFGAQQTRAGLIFSGEVVPRWTYRTHFVIGSAITRVVTGVEDVDFEGDGASDGLVVSRRFVPGVDIEQLWVNYKPVQVKNDDDRELVAIDFRLGQMRVPFSKQNRTQNNSLLFPRRNQAVTSFINSSDLGGMASLSFIDERIAIDGGVFNGTGLAVSQDNRRGPLWAARAEFAPLGKVGSDESALEARKRPLFSLGGGMLWSPYRLYDSAGNDTLTRARDLLLGASAKFVYYGLALQGEFIRRQVTDNLSDRPFLSTGAYGQLSYIFGIKKKLYLGPAGNFGWTQSEQAVVGLDRYYTTDGLAIYIPNEKRLDAVRVSVFYQGEWLVDEGASAQGGTMQVQVKF
ncbi:MAG: porin [Myxococcota bacterium]